VGENVVVLLLKRKVAAQLFYSTQTGAQGVNNVGSGSVSCFQ
jgi:hypothetical protein